MSRLFGYEARLVMTDGRGRRLVIDAIALSPDTDLAVIRLEEVARAMSEAETTGAWGPSPGWRKPWTVES